MQLTEKNYLLKRNNFPSGTMNRISVRLFLFFLFFAKASKENTKKERRDGTVEEIYLRGKRNKPRSLQYNIDAGRQRGVLTVNATVCEDLYLPSDIT